MRSGSRTRCPTSCAREKRRRSSHDANVGRLQTTHAETLARALQEGVGASIVRLTKKDGATIVADAEEVDGVEGVSRA